MSLLVYLFLILLFVVGALYYFFNRILANIILKKMESVTRKNLELDNQSVFAKIDFDKLNKMIKSLSKNVNLEDDPDVKKNIQNLVKDLASDLENNMQKIEQQHEKEVKDQKIKQNNMDLDDVFAQLNNVLNNKDEDFSKVLDRLSKEKKDK